MRRRTWLAQGAGFLVAALALSSQAWSNETKVLQLNGVEISPGFIVGGVRVGTTFVGQATGGLSGSWILTIRYSPPHPGGTNKILGGTWTLTVCRGGRVVGELFTTVYEGEAVWDDKITIAEVWANLKILGGTGVCSGARGNGSFEGFLTHERFPPRVSGTLTLKLTP
jgi:hypothetical protein